MSNSIANDSVIHRLEGDEIYDALAGKFIDFSDNLLVEDFLVFSDGKGSKKWGNREQYRKFLQRMIDYGNPYIIGPELDSTEKKI